MEVRKKELTPDEQREILGGNIIPDPGDTNNNNKTFGCLCWYNNTSAINNNNEVSGCTCQCT